MRLLEIVGVAFIASFLMNFASGDSRAPQVLSIRSLMPGNSTKKIRWNTPEMKVESGSLHFCVAGYPDWDVSYDRGVVKAIKGTELEVNSKKCLVIGSTTQDLASLLGKPTEQAAHIQIYRFRDYELLVRLSDSGVGGCRYFILADKLDDVDPKWMIDRELCSW